MDSGLKQYLELSELYYKVNTETEHTVFLRLYGNRYDLANVSVYLGGWAAGKDTDFNKGVYLTGAICDKDKLEKIKRYLTDLLPVKCGSCNITLKKGTEVVELFDTYYIGGYAGEEERQYIERNPDNAKHYCMDCADVLLLVDLKKGKTITLGEGK